MTFQPKSQYLPTDVKDYAAPRPRMDLVWMALAGCLALVAYLEPVEPVNAAPQVVDSITGLANAGRPAVAAPDMQIACMNERLHITWIDPHTGDIWATFCDSQRISKPL